MKTHFYHASILEACTHNHLTVDEIFERVKKSHPNAGYSTIYRNVEELALGGQLKKISGIGSKAIFEKVIDRHVAHFVDEATGTVYDLEISEEWIFSKLPRGFAPKAADLRIYGTVEKTVS